MARNDRPESIGTGGRIASESVAALDRNRWPECVGIRSEARHPAAEDGRSGHERYEAVDVQSMTNVKKQDPGFFLQ